MLICNHIIKDEEIIGIGPLMMQFPAEDIQYQIYGRRKLYFVLHLKNHTTQIESDWFDIGTGSFDDLAEHEKKQRQLYMDFKTDYEASKGIIEKLVCQH